MSLLTSPIAIEILNDLRTNYAVKATRNRCELDRFFWLHGHRGSRRDRRLRIAPAFETPTNHRKERFRICNLVLQGGGTLGLAHAGFVTGLEAAGIRFAGLAGTSAGSILAMGVAAIRGHDITTATHQKLISITETAPMDTFIDGPRPIRVMIKRMLKGRGVLAPEVLSGWLAALFRLRDRRGLNPGTGFETWFASVLDELGWNSIDDLYEALDAIWADLEDLRALPSDSHTAGPILRDPAKADPSLAQRPAAALLQLIAMAMPVGLKFKLPQDLYYLSAEYERVSPARLVRTSMSIPAFFDPVVMQTNKSTWPRRVQSDITDLLTAVQSQEFSDLNELAFLDGGMMSNLPSDSFRDLMPDVPTIVVPLVNGGSTQRITRRRRLGDLAKDAAACGQAVRLQHDRETWAQNSPLKAAFDLAEQRDRNVRAKKRPARRYPVQIAPIDTGEANWLNFVMSASEKADLFETGLLRAQKLLKSLSAGDSL
ncbi:MAG: patatin-like phospholipase family protein [Pseudomonadota bacterium]